MNQAIDFDRALRRWVRNAQIYPAPQKVGRTYFVRPDAEYIRDWSDPSQRLVDRIRRREDE
jgi:hypothetical protein